MSDTREFFETVCRCNDIEFEDEVHNNSEFAQFWFDDPDIGNELRNEYEDS